MNAGDLKWIAIVEAEQKAKTGTGAATGNWTLVGKRRCSVEEVTGTKADQGGSKQTKIQWFTVVMRYSPGFEMKASYRLTIKGRPWNGIVMRVNAVRHDGDKQSISLSCVVED